jgi:negative regulator of flagellin synthesis FlgM
MTEKITGQGFRPIDAGTTRRTERGGPSSPSGAGTTGTSATGETVDVGRSELLLSRLEQALDAAPVVDAGRVRAIKNAIASGAYEIDPRAIADKLVELERMLG